MTASVMAMWIQNSDLFVTLPLVAAWIVKTILLALIVEFVGRDISVILYYQENFAKVRIVCANEFCSNWVNYNNGDHNNGYDVLLP